MVNNKFTPLLLIVLTLVMLFNSCQVSDKDLNALNNCYDLSSQTFFEGFVKNDPDLLSDREVFIYALKNELYDSVYSKSKFNDREFYFSPGNKENGNKEFQVNRCKDTLIAMYLAYTLAYDSENFQKEFMAWYPTIDFYLSPHSEFSYLILEHYDCTEEELNIVIEAFNELSKETILIVDKYKALDTAYFLVTKYNEKHSGKGIDFPKELGKKLNSYSKYIKENPDEVTFWLGYTW